MPARKLKTTLLVSLLCAVVACTPQIRKHGYVPSDDELSAIAVGRDNRESVLAALGSPTSASMMRDDGWYYISSQVKQETFHPPQEIDRQIVAISFDGNGVVSNVERLSLADGRVVALNRRVTDIPVKGPGFFSQLLGSIGNFNLADSL
jgi:outer membrane protein assembly factor BamE (lipoprotein component of BamABCDE complex)